MASILIFLNALDTGVMRRMMGKKICQNFIRLTAILSLLLSIAFDPVFADSKTCAKLLSAFSGKRGIVDAVISTGHKRAEELRNRLFAVHATPIFPDDGVLVAGARDVSKSDSHVATEPPSFRPTIHFSIGELVRRHRSGSWDEKPYAIVLPIKSLEKQLVNINPYDSYILGNFKIPPEAIFVVPENEIHRVPSGFKYVTHGHGTTLRQAVDQVILTQGGWKITMKERTEVGSLANLNGTNINTIEFFEPLLKENRNLSFGNHLHSEVGEIFRMGNVEQALNLLMKPFNPYGITLSYNEMLFLNGFIRHHLEKLDSFLSSIRLPEHSMIVYRVKRQNVLEWLNIVEMEILIRRRNGVTLTRADNSISENLIQLKGDPQKLSHYVNTLVQSNRLRISTEDENPASPISLAEYFTATDPEEVMHLLNQYPQVLKKTDANLFWMLYAIKRALVISESRARSEKLFELIDGKISILERQVNSERTAKSLFDVLSKSLDYESSRLPLALAILSRPSVRMFLQSHLDMNLPAQVSLEDILKTHPETRALFETRSLPYRSAQEALAYQMLQRLERPSRESSKDRSLLSFSFAKSQAMKIKWMEQRLEENMVQVMQPMKTTRSLDSMAPGSRITIYEQILRGDYGGLDDLAQKLGLSTQFRQMFPDDQSFWLSSFSLVQLYQKLSNHRDEEN